MGTKTKLLKMVLVGNLPITFYSQRYAPQFSTVEKAEVFPVPVRGSQVEDLQECSEAQLLAAGREITNA